MSEIRRGTIQPIRADKIRFKGERTVLVPLKPPGVHLPQIVSHEPLVVSSETIEHAQKVAQRLIATMGNLPPTPEAGDLLAMAYTVLHFKKES